MMQVFVGGKNKRGAQAAASRIVELEAEVAALKSELQGKCLHLGRVESKLLKQAEEYGVLKERHDKLTDKVLEMEKKAKKSQRGGKGGGVQEEAEA